jgi:hypothetical protein
MPAQPIIEGTKKGTNLAASSGHFWTFVSKADAEKGAASGHKRIAITL